MTGTTAPTPPRWITAWPDLLAFAAGLALAWGFKWSTKDLVWSLWLSSLTVGYAMIVWSIFGGAVFVGCEAWRDRALLGDASKVPLLLGGFAFFAGGLFLLAFFTVHFGMFHFVHSIFLNLFFPIAQMKIPPDPSSYLRVLHDYCYFVPLAALAERQAFRLTPAEPAGPPDTSVRAADIAARKLRNARVGGMTGMMAPYRNVVRLHLLIFFFAFAHFVKLENFGVYTVVYAAYFFPWALLRKPAAA